MAYTNYFVLLLQEFKRLAKEDYAKDEKQTREEKTQFKINLFLSLSLRLQAHLLNYLKLIKQLMQTLY